MYADRMNIESKKIRRCLASLLHTASLWSGDALRRIKAIRKPRILMYHNVGIGALSSDMFKWQLKLLRREREVMPLYKFVQRLNDDSVTGEEIVITFDDGVRNHFSTVYPILSEFGVPATFFVCPGLIDSGQWIWNMELRVRLNMLSFSKRKQIIRDLNCQYVETEDIINWAKELPYVQRSDLENVVRTNTPQFSPTEQQLDRYAPMTWDQIKLMDPEIITIGSHTLGHPILTTLTYEKKQSEIVDSQRLLENRIGRKVGLFCYPNGDNDSDAVGIVRSQYCAAVTTQPRFVEENQDVCLLPRIPAGDNKGLFMRRLHRPTA